MIKSQRELRISQSRLAQFDEAIRSFDLRRSPPGIQPSAHQAAYEALMGIRKDLQLEISQYERLKRSGLSAVRISKLGDIPGALVQARVALGLTQAKLAAKLGVKPQQVQRWERSEYENASFSSVLEVAYALGVDKIPLGKHAPLDTTIGSTQNFTISRLIERIVKQNPVISTSFSGSRHQDEVRQDSGRRPVGAQSDLTAESATYRVFKPGHLLLHGRTEEFAAAVARSLAGRGGQASQYLTSVRQIMPSGEIVGGPTIIGPDPGPAQGAGMVGVTIDEGQTQNILKSHVGIKAGTGASASNKIALNQFWQETIQ